MAAQEEPSTAEERVPLGALLIAEGLLNEVQLHQALHLGSQTGERLGEIVVRQGLASEEDVARLLAEQWDLGYVDRASIWFDANALARLSREDAQRLEAMPTRVEDGRVVVAVAEPTEERLAALREVIGEDTVVVVVPKAALEAGLHSEFLASNGQPAEKPAAEPDEEDAAAGCRRSGAAARTGQRRAGRGRRHGPPDDGLSSDDDDLAPRSSAELPAYKQAKATHRARRSQPPRRGGSPPPRRAPRPPRPVSGGLAESIAQLIEAQIGAATAAPAAESAEARGARAADRAAGEASSGEPRGARRAGQHLKSIAGRPRQALAAGVSGRSTAAAPQHGEAVRAPDADRVSVPQHDKTSVPISARFPVSMNASAGLNAKPPMPFMTMIGLGTFSPSALAESRLPSTPPAKTPAAIATLARRHTRQRQHGDEDEARADEPDPPTCGGRPRGASRRCASPPGRSAARTAAMSRSANSRSLHASDDTARWPNMQHRSPPKAVGRPGFSAVPCADRLRACRSAAARRAAALRVALRASMRACSSARCWESSRSCWAVTSLGKLERRSWSFRRRSDSSRSSASSRSIRAFRSSASAPVIGLFYQTRRSGGEPPALAPPALHERVDQHCEDQRAEGCEDRSRDQEGRDVRAGDRVAVMGQQGPAEPVVVVCSSAS